MELRPDADLGGKLRLLRPLGQGGMGVVWAARHLALDTDVAVKLVRPERVAADPTLVARFEREARATARIAHPHVVRIMDYGTFDGTVPYIVMELLEGYTLAELLARGGRLSFATARALVEQVGSALESAHARGVVHRDVKPHNVFITQASAGYPLFVKVLDFGIAKVMGDAQVPSGASGLTETGTIIGSPPYMSPEQLEGSRDVDLRSDLWSLGVIVYEALTGTLPFQGASFVSVGAAVLRGVYTPASELRPNLPPGTDDWFTKTLCLDPEGRFASARELVEAFSRLDAQTAFDTRTIEAEPSAPIAVSPFATTIEVSVNLDPHDGATAGHAPVAERPPPSADPPGRPRRWRRIGLLAAATCAAVGGGVGLSAPRSTSAPECPAGMAFIGGGTFAMGSPADGETPSDESPQHSATLRPFCLDRTEVTLEAYSTCASCDAPPTAVEVEGLTPNGRAFWSPFCNRPATPDHPVTCVDWNQAKAYCASLGERLPTEAEWELAARGPSGRTYPWGNESPSAERLNGCGEECSRMLTERLEKLGKSAWPRMYAEDDSAPATAPVGRYPRGATPEGVLDLAGNVWEWTDSRYCPYGHDDCDDSRRVLRGGGWDTVESQYVRSAHRRPSVSSARGWSIGFRCAKSL